MGTIQVHICFFGIGIAAVRKTHGPPRGPQGSIRRQFGSPESILEVLRKVNFPSVFRDTSRQHPVFPRSLTFESRRLNLLLDCFVGELFGYFHVVFLFVIVPSRRWGARGNSVDLFDWQHNVALYRVMIKMIPTGGPCRIDQLFA